MSRGNLDAQSAAASGAAQVYIAELVSIAFPSGTVYWTSAAFDVSWNGTTWLKGPWIKRLDSPVENSDSRARTVTLTFSTAAPMLDRVMNDAYQFASVQIYIAFFNSSWSLLGQPYSIGGPMLASSATVSLESDAASVTFELETPEVFEARDSAVLVTNAQQQRRYPGDTGMQYTTRISDLTVSWGGGKTVVGRPGTSVAGSGSAKPIGLDRDRSGNR